ncbi:MAG: flippase-like domain-containing protein [Planctomycetes bacterium]|nr:flippase-like domain-containing protein [Planctomycetota bacterium]
MNKRLKKGLLLGVKLLIAAALLVWVLSKVHWYDYVKDAKGSEYSVLEVRSVDGRQMLKVYEGKLWWKSQPQERPASDFESVRQGSSEVLRWGFATSLENIDKFWFTVAFCCFLIPVLIFSTRWWLLLRLQRIRISLWEAIRLTFLGQFFNYVVPGTVGGDLIKAWYVAKHTEKKAAVLVSVFVDRVLGLTELVFMAGAMLLVVWLGGLEKNVQNLKTPAITVGVVVCLVIFTLVFILSKRFRRIFRLEKIYGRMSFAHHIQAAGDAASLYRKRLPQLLQAIAITIGGHVIWIGSIALVGYSLHLHQFGVAWYSYFLYIPLIYIIGAIPVTPGGVGLIEKLYTVFFAAVSPSSVLALALLARLVPMFWTLPGAIVAITGPRLPKADQMQAELDAAEQVELESAQKAGPDDAADNNKFSTEQSPK